MAKRRYWWKKKRGKKKRVAAAGVSYAERDENLKKIGFANYGDYLRSDLWQHVKDRVFAKKGRQCTECGQFAYTCHHARYTVADLLGQSLSLLFPICKTCHDRIERRGDGSKRTLHQANSEWFKGRHVAVAGLTERR